MTKSKNITINRELTIGNAGVIRDKIVSRASEGTGVSLALKNISDLDFAGVQLLHSLLLSKYLDTLSIHKLHPEIKNLLINTGFDSIIKNLK